MLPSVVSTTPLMKRTRGLARNAMACATSSQTAGFRPVTTPTLVFHGAAGPCLALRAPRRGVPASHFSVALTMHGWRRRPAIVDSATGQKSHINPFGDENAQWRGTSVKVRCRNLPQSMPIRLSPTTTTFRVLPIARVKLGVSGSGDIASNSEQGPEGVERVERQSRARVSRYERNTTAHDRKNHASATALQLRRGPRQPATLPVKLSM